MGRFKELGFRLASPFLKRQYLKRARKFMEDAGLEAGMLKGKKTYIAAAVALVTAIASFLTGEISIPALLEQSWQILFPVIAIFLRSGVKNGGE